MLAMFKYLCCIFLISSLHVESSSSQSLESELKNEVDLGKVAIYDMSTLPGGRKTRPQAVDRRLDIYCYAGLAKKDLWRLWTSYNLRLIMPTEYYVVYLASNSTEVYRQHREATTSWLKSIMPWRTDYIPLSVFNETCVGISTMEGYSVSLRQNAIDPWLVGYLLTGLVLFFTAKRLSRNLMFYYGTGISFGLLASLLIVVFVLSRFMPQKYGAYMILVGGWSVTLWFLQYAWDNIQKILEQYIEYVAGYFIFTAILSFAILYYKGPVTNPRLINLIKWALQVVSLIMVYNGTQIPEISISLIAILLLIHAIPKPSFALRSYTFWWSWVPRFVPKTRLLTEDEFVVQGREETKKALESLREYCQSPDCNAWKTMSRLHTPQKFASFVESGSHLSDDERYAFEQDPQSLNYEDSDESEMSFMLNSP